MGWARFFQPFAAHHIRPSNLPILTPALPSQAVVAIVDAKLSNQQYAVKFFSDDETFAAECAVYELLVRCCGVGTAGAALTLTRAHAQGRERALQHDFVHDARSHAGETLGFDIPFPSYLVMKRGVSMCQWVRLPVPRCSSPRHVPPHHPLRPLPTRNLSSGAAACAAAADGAVDAWGGRQPGGNAAPPRPRAPRLETRQHRLPAGTAGGPGHPA